ncbi:MAG: hypothetical protein ABFQ65_02090 [Nanoarchaeota archaeon]
MILGTFYGQSHWNNKFYAPKNGYVWTEYDGKFVRFRGNGIHKKDILPKEEISKLKKIPYTHLICYAGKNCNRDDFFFHQFPRGDKILQEIVLAKDLEKNSLFPKEIITPKISQ